jgi:lysophospholipase L1-like esterase
VRRRPLSSALALLLWIAVTALATHRSELPVFLGRYSAEFAAVLAAATCLAALVSLLALGFGTWLVRTFPRLRSGVAVAGLVSVSLLVALAVTESLVRAFDLFGVSYYEEISRYARDTIPDPDLNYRHRPELVTRYQGAQVAFNELGLRERPLAEKNPARPRLLLLGDSVVFGLGVEMVDTLGRQLERVVEARYGASIETVNSGVASYNTKIELEFLRRHGERIDPDMVLLVFVSNDVDPTLPPPENPGVMPDPLERPLEAARYLLSRSRVLSMAWHMIPALLAVGEDVAVDRDSPGWRAAMDSLVGIAKYCDERGIPFVAMLYRMLPGTRVDAIARDMTRLAEQHGFVYTDSLPWFDGQNLRRLTVSFVDTHPNSAGHRVLAEGVAEVLHAADLVPSHGERR